MSVGGGADRVAPAPADGVGEDFGRIGFAELPGTDLPVHHWSVPRAAEGLLPPYEGSSPVARLAHLTPVPHRLRGCSSQQTPTLTKCPALRQAPLPRANGRPRSGCLWTLTS